MPLMKLCKMLLNNGKLLTFFFPLKNAIRDLQEAVSLCSQLKIFAFYLPLYALAADCLLLQAI